MSHDDHAKKHGRHAVIMAWSWPCSAMIMARSWHGNHVFPTRAIYLKILVAKNLRFSSRFVGKWENSILPGMPFYENVMCFHHFCIRCHILKFLSTSVGIRADSGKICTSQRWKPNFSELRKPFCLKQRWWALVIFILSESVLETVKFLQQRWLSQGPQPGRDLDVLQK